MKDQHGVLAEERLHRLQRVAVVFTRLTFDLLTVEVAQVHGVDVVGHIRSSEHDEAVDHPVTVVRQDAVWDVLVRRP